MRFDRAAKPAGGTKLVQPCLIYYEQNKHRVEEPLGHYRCKNRKNTWLSASHDNSGERETFHSFIHSLALPHWWCLKTSPALWQKLIDDRRVRAFIACCVFRCERMAFRSVREWLCHRRRHNGVLHFALYRDILLHASTAFCFLPVNVWNGTKIYVCVNNVPAAEKSSARDGSWWCFYISTQHTRHVQRLTWGICQNAHAEDECARCAFKPSF